MEALASLWAFKCTSRIATRLFLVVIWCQFLSVGTLVLAQNAEVINTNDSGAGSLRQAVADVGDGDEVQFQPVVKGGTIDLTSGLLTVNKSMNFVNNSGGVVTINCDMDNYVEVTAVDGMTSFGSGLVFHSETNVAMGASEAIAPIYITGNHTINELRSTLETSSLSDEGGMAMGICSAGSLEITNGILSDSISASSRISDVSGIVTATSYGIMTGGDLTIAGGISKDCDITANSYDETGSNEGHLYAHGIQCNDLTISGGMAGNITAESSHGTPYGETTGIVADSVEITGGLSGSVSAISKYSDSDAKAIDSYTSIVIDEVSGTISAKGLEAIGLCGSRIIGTDQDSPMVISGTVDVQGVDAAAALFTTQGLIELKVEQTGTLSATASDGDAYAIQMLGGGSVLNLELVAGCTVKGDIICGRGSIDNILTLSGTTGTTTYSGDIKEGFGLDINVTGGTWNLLGDIRGKVLNVSGGKITIDKIARLTYGANVSGGMLIVNGEINRNVTVGNNGTFCGTGTIGSVENSGTLAPGNSIGTMTVTGDYTQNLGSTLEIEINDASKSDLINVGGSAKINGGTVDVQAEDGTYSVGMTYTFLTAAGGVTGEFDAITDNLVGLYAALDYSDPNSIKFTLAKRDYNAEARTYNQRAVARYLTDHTATATGDFLTVLNALDPLSGDDARAAFDAMSGEIYGSLLTVGIENTDRFLRMLATRLRSRNLGQEWFAYSNASSCGALAFGDNWDDSLLVVRGQNPIGNVGGNRAPWATAYGVGAQIASDGNASGLNYSTGGTAFGLEKVVNSEMLLGAVGGYSQTFVLLDDRSDRGTIDSAQAGLYLYHDSGPSYLTGIAIYGHNSYKMRRQIAFGNLARRARSDYDGNEFAFYVETGRNYDFRYAFVQPYAALQYIQLHQDGFTESGADSVDLSIGGIGADSFRGLLGTRILKDIATRNGHQIALEGRALWRHEFLDEARIVDAAFAGQPGGAFVINGVNVDRDAAILGGGLNFCLCSGAELYVNYDLLVSQNYTAHAGTGGLSLAW